LVRTCHDSICTVGLGVHCSVIQAYNNGLELEITRVPEPWNRYPQVGLPW